jgi:hypothetical protein
VDDDTRTALGRVESLLLEIRAREDRTIDLVKASLIVLSGLTARLERLERGAIDDPHRNAVVRVDGTRTVREIRVVYADGEEEAVG